LKVSLIISTYNSALKLKKVLEHIKGGSILPDEIIISDDGSNNETVKIVMEWQSEMPIKHIWHEDKGFRKCKILNKSLNSINYNYAIFLDGDCIPHKSFVADHKYLAQKGFFIQGRRCFVQEKEVSKLINNKTNIRKLFLTGKLSGYFKSIRFPKPIIKTNRSQRGLIGCNWSAWYDDLLEVNGFDEDYEGWGIGEDSDICTRLYNLGRERKFVYGHAIVYHLNHPELPKSHHLDSQYKLSNVIKSGKIKCDNGITKLKRIHDR
jgi:glycosyltransferase involved in cell wall biosynthesis